MKKLLFVLNIGFDKPGPSVHLLQDIIQAGLNKDCLIDVILAKTQSDGETMPVFLSKNENLRYTCIDVSEQKSCGFIRRYLREIRFSQKCFEKINRFATKYDAIFVQSTPAAYFYLYKFKRLKSRIVFNVQDIFPYNLKLSGQLPLEKLSFPVFKKLQNIGYQIADQIITISDDMKQTLIDDGVDAKKIAVVYNWSYSDAPISLKKLDYDNVFDLSLKQTQFNVIYAGNIGKMQNVELIAKTAQRMVHDTSIHFYIIGDGANRHNVEKLVAGLNNVTMCPMQAAKYAESVYAQADVNIIPLMPGGIRTALPSKTATVLRTDKPVVFCVDKNSKTEALFSKMKDVYFCDCEKPDELVFLLNNLKSHKGESKRVRETPSFITIKNSYKYVDYMINDTCR